MSTLRIRTELLPKRCEVCHQTDCFNPQTNLCSRCTVQRTPHSFTTWLVPATPIERFFSSLPGIFKTLFTHPVLIQHIQMVFLSTVAMFLALTIVYLEAGFYWLVTLALWLVCITGGLGFG